MTLIRSLLISVFVVSLIQPAYSGDAENQIEQLFNSYFALFNAGDTEALASQIFEPPVQFSNGESHGTWAAESDVVHGFVESLATLRDQGWARSEISSIHVCVIAEHYALVELGYFRIDADGNVLAPQKRKGVYIVLRTDNGWRIIADYAQEPSVQINCSS